MGGHHVAGPETESGFPLSPHFQPTLSRLLLGALTGWRHKHGARLAAKKQNANHGFCFCGLRAENFWLLPRVAVPTEGAPKKGGSRDGVGGCGGRGRADLLGLRASSLRDL
jgi:hypothetical protein